MMNFVHWITLSILYSKSLLFVFTFKHWRALRWAWKNVLMVLEKSIFLSVKVWEPCVLLYNVTWPAVCQCLDVAIMPDAYINCISAATVMRLC